MNVATQSTTRSRSRSRSRSVPRKYARTTSRISLVSIPRSVRYNGINKITRNCNVELTYVNNSTDLTRGYTINNEKFTEFGIIYSPKFVTILYGGTNNEATYSIPGASDITNLYDLLSLDKVEITFSTNQAASVVRSVPADLSGGNPILLVSNDDTDVNSNNIEAMLQESDVRFLRLSDSQIAIKHTAYPKFQAQAYQTPTASGYLPRSGFVRSSDDVVMYGTKVCVQNVGATTEGGAGSHKLFMRFKLFYTCKNVR